MWSCMCCLVSNPLGQRSISIRYVQNVVAGVAQRLCNADCHATARGAIPNGNGVKTELHVLRKGQRGAVSKWPRCRWDVNHNQPTNKTCIIALNDLSMPYMLWTTVVFPMRFLCIFIKPFTFSEIILTLIGNYDIHH